MRDSVRRLALTLTSALVSTTAAADCNGAAGPCDLPNGTYHIVLPEGTTGPVPAIIPPHGYGGKGLGSIRNKRMVNPMLGRGCAVIAPDG